MKTEAAGKVVVAVVVVVENSEREKEKAKQSKIKGLLTREVYLF